MKPQVVINIPADEALRERLRAAAPELEFHFIEAEEDSPVLEEAEILFGQFGSAIFKQAKRVKWLQLLSSGVDRFMKPGVLPEGVMLTSATGSYGDLIAEFMLAGTLSLLYHFHEYRDQQRAGVWKLCDLPGTLMGRTAVILGLGDIGESYARRLKALGVYTIGVRRARLQKSEVVDELYPFDDPALDGLFPRADIVAMSLPNTTQTKGLLSRARIGSLKQEAIVINIGRGSTLDEAALTAALQEGRIAGAALDVFAQEPLPAESPLWRMKNVIITPHAAGNDLAPAVIERTMALFFRNLAAYREGRPLENVIDPSRQYASRD